MNHNVPTSDNQNSLLNNKEKSGVLKRVRSKLARSAAENTVTFEHEDKREIISYSLPEARNVTRMIARSWRDAGETKEAYIRKGATQVPDINKNTGEVMVGASSGEGVSIVVRHELVSYDTLEGRHSVQIYGFAGNDTNKVSVGTSLFAVDKVTRQDGTTYMHGEPAVFYKQSYDNFSDILNKYEPKKTELNEAVAKTFGDGQSLASFIKSQVEGGDVRAEQEQLIEHLKQREYEEASRGDVSVYVPYDNMPYPGIVYYDY